MLNALKSNFFAAALIGCAATFAAGQSRCVFTVAASADVETERVELGQIAKTHCSGEAADKLMRISLGNSPAVGMERQIHKDQIAIALTAAGAGGAVSLISPDVITITRIGQAVAADLVKAAIEDALAHEFSGSAAVVRITRLGDIPETRVPAGKVAATVKLTGIRSFSERFSAPVEIRVDGVLARTFSVSMEIEANAAVLVAAHQIAPNQKISPSDLRLEDRVLTRSFGSYFTDVRILHGMQTVKPINAGSPILSDAVGPRYVVRIGDPVRIEGRSGNVFISITGEARASGRIGDRIAVKNTQSGAMLQAVVVDEGLARVII